MLHRFLLRLLMLMLLGATARAAEIAPSLSLRDAEETYELRLQRLMDTKGRKVMVEFLQRELAERPRPYVKAWYANYLLYGEELGVKDVVDPKRGFALAKESRAEGSLFGLELVGRAYGDGRGSGYRDTTEALKCLNAAAELGRDSAWAALASYYFFGTNVRRDTAKAEECARRGAWLGATSGLFNLASWWDDAKYAGTPDHAKALVLYYEAAELGELAATQRLAEFSAKGDAAAEKYNQLAFVVAAREGAVAYPARLRNAVKWLDTHAAAEDVTVQLALAELMIERMGPVYDPKKAREKLTRAAALGSDDARAMLGTMAWRGIGQSADPAAAVAIWTELAAKGNARALNSLGWLHWWGNGAQHGVVKDAAKAFELCHRSADLGYYVGQLNTADCYAHGIGTEVNYYQAAKYYDVLGRRGFVRGRDMRARMLAHVQD